ncbi:MAG TPA: beta-propeller fold lactonase family protein [Sedimentisphaerales bacterium]|nr:beta-propeller fold lactonase family protein [Sedimentisphaerales bacterium]
MRFRAFIAAIISSLALSTVYAESLPVYFGTYTSGRNASEGIYRSVLDTETGRLSAPALAAEAKNPSFLEIHPNGKFLYAVSESGDAGTVSAYAIDPDTGNLKLLNSRPSGGSGPCHVNIDRSAKNVLVTNYGSGSASVIPIATDGSLAEPTGFVQHEGSSINLQRQKGPHAHSINVSPDNRFVFVADLGLDKIMIYRLDVEKGTITANDPAFAKVKPGSGPRHFTFGADGRYAYVINEMGGTVTAFSYEPASGTLTQIQTVTTLPDGFAGSSSCAEVRVHPGGKFLYGSNRGHDSIAVYRIDPAKGTLTFVEHERAGIKTPRNFNIDPTGRFCLVANQGGNSIVVFRIDQKTGALEPTGHKISVGRPVCVRFLRADPPVDVEAERAALREDFLKLRFGLFLHFNMATYVDREWANGYEDPAFFKPDRLDCQQWAEVASAAGMKYGVLTVKHTGGWCLWDSDHTAHDITRFIHYKNGRGDIVREFVDAFRARGLKVGLYYCFPGDFSSSRHGNGLPEGKPDLHGLPPEAAGDYVGFVKKQLTELLTNYGPIDLLWIDQYSNKYTRARWQEVRAHIRSLQPRCLVIGNNAHNLKDSDVYSCEYPWDSKGFPPEGNRTPAEVCDKISRTWFWNTADRPEHVKDAQDIIKMLKLCSERNANYLLNVPPDRQGMISGIHLERMQEVATLLNATASAADKK